MKKIDTYKLLRYFRCETSESEEKEVMEFISDDPDGTHLNMYKDARILYEGLVLHSELPAENVTVPKVVKIPTVLRWAVRVAAVVAIVLVSSYISNVRTIDTLSAQFRTVSVPAGKTMQMTLEDGTKMWINGRSEVEIPMVFARKSRGINVKDGEVYLQVAKDVDRPFYVDTYAGTVKVLGTEFDVEVDKNTRYFSTSLVSGSVRIEGKGGRNMSYTMKPNEVVCMKNGVWTKSVVRNMESLTCWKEGLIDVSNMSFDSLISKFEDVFDVKFVVCRDEKPEIDFTRGKIRVSDGIESALELLKLSSDMDYEINRTDNIIYIR